MGDPIPDFSLQTFDGKNFSRESLERQPTLLVFWNTWCPECMRKLPEINVLLEKLGPKGLTVLAVNTAINDSERKARAYWEKYRYRFPVGFDHDFEIGQAFGVRGVPTIFLIDAGGIARYKGSLLPDNMDVRVKELAGKE